MDPAFVGRNVVVTGGTGALGTAVVGALLERGAACWIPCLNSKEADRFSLSGHERVHMARDIDVTNEQAVARFYASVGVVALGGAGAGAPSAGLWASIHIAGGFAMSPVEGTTLADFRSQIDTNLVTCFLCCREAVRRMKAGAGAGGGGGAGGGRIVNVAARPALEPRLGAGMTAYTAAKAAVAAFTVALGEEVAKDDILVNAVVPSIMDTPANRKAMPSADHTAWARVEDVAATIVFLASRGGDGGNGVTRSALVPVYGRT